MATSFQMLSLPGDCYSIDYVPAIPPYAVKTPHLHGAPTTEETFSRTTRRCRRDEALQSGSMVLYG